MTTSNKTSTPGKTSPRQAAVQEETKATPVVTDTATVVKKDIEEPVKYLPSRRVWPD